MYGRYNPLFNIFDLFSELTSNTSGEITEDIEYVDVTDEPEPIILNDLLETNGKTIGIIGHGTTIPSSHINSLHGHIIVSSPTNSDTDFISQAEFGGYIDNSSIGDYRDRVYDDSYLYSLSELSYNYYDYTDDQYEFDNYEDSLYIIPFIPVIFTSSVKDIRIRSPGL
jgi:hypothetical protein